MSTSYFYSGSLAMKTLPGYGMRSSAGKGLALPSTLRCCSSPAMTLNSRAFIYSQEIPGLSSIPRKYVHELFLFPGNMSTSYFYSGSLAMKTLPGYGMRSSAGKGLALPSRRTQACCCSLYPHKVFLVIPRRQFNP